MWLIFLWFLFGVIANIIIIREEGKFIVGDLGVAIGLLCSGIAGFFIVLFMIIDTKIKRNRNKVIWQKKK